MKEAKPITLALAIGAVLALTGCQKEASKETAPASQELQEVPVVSVTKKTLYRIDELPGEIQAYQDVAIYPKVPGFIDWIGVDRGSVVKKGQLLCRLIAPELKAQQSEFLAKSKAVQNELQEARSRLAAAKATLLEARALLAADSDTYRRTKEASLVPGVVAPNEVVVLEQKVESDKEKVNAWQENVNASENAVSSLLDAVDAAKKNSENYKDIADYLNVRAPFDGYVTERNMHVGSFVGPLGKSAYPPIVRVQELGLLRIVTPVPEANAGGVLPGAPVEFTVSTHPGTKFVGTVARLGNALEQKTRTMPVELNYLNPGWRVLPGMFCRVLWPTRRPNPSLFVPPGAVETKSTLSTFVCRIKENRVEWVKVERGEMMQGLTEVFGNLQEGDLVAQDCTDALKPGAKVKPILVESAVKPAVKRPVYDSHDTIYTTPDAERIEMKKSRINPGQETQNSDKHDQ